MYWTPLIPTWEWMNDYLTVHMIFHYNTVHTVKLNPLHLKMCFAKCKLTWMFELHCAEWRRCSLTLECSFSHSSAAFTLNMSLMCGCRQEANRGPAYNLDKCDVETWNHQCTNIEILLFSEVSSSEINNICIVMDFRFFKVGEDIENRSFQEF